MFLMKMMMEKYNLMNSKNVYNLFIMMIYLQLIQAKKWLLNKMKKFNVFHNLIKKLVLNNYKIKNFYDWLKMNKMH